MCGIVSLVYGEDRPEMGKEATELLRRLEYRGYDSTGASFIDGDRKIALVKKVGAPSKVTKELGIPSFKGQRFIGQVRWATFGAVTDVNSQPHRVKCKVEMVGAHNGNISNTDSLKKSLAARGHKVVSDNDGEIIVHLIEEYYAENLRAPGKPLGEMRRAYDASGLKDAMDEKALLMIDAIRSAEAEAEGSYAAAVADPDVPGVFAVKSGSSLYAGIGTDAAGPFVVVSSDLTSVLSKTRFLIPLAEGEGVWYTHDRYLVFTLHGDPAFSRPMLKRSKLNVRDTALNPKYKYYMEQEINSAPENMDEIIRYYFRDDRDEALFALFEEKRDLAKEIIERALSLSGCLDDASLRKGFADLSASPEFRELWSRVAANPEAHGAIAERSTFHSDERILLGETSRVATGSVPELSLLDLAFIWKKRRTVLRYSRELQIALREARKAGGTIYFIASGTSYHAALTGSYYFNDLAGIPTYPCNPGLFRSTYLDSLGENDILVSISQSGETKDLVDILQEARSRQPKVKRVSLVNNENSRIPQELSDFYLPILCGPEIAVAATKSFVNQLMILYVLAASFALPEREVLEKVRKAKALLSDTMEFCSRAVDEAAGLLYLKPSMHLLGTGLIGLAREGALKIREVVLNHSEGYDAAEFKHGPNTILGKNTVFSLESVERAVAFTLAATVSGTKTGDGTAASFLRENPRALEGLFGNYPLVFVCPPEERDIRITISQIHTHKIRGADIFLFAEKNPELALAAEGRPTGNETYVSRYIEIPATGDRNLFVFGAAVALQYLALRMSVLKMTCLDGLGVRDHGVHPDAPKNVSKSITVD